MCQRCYDILVSAGNSSAVSTDAAADADTSVTAADADAAAPVASGSGNQTLKKKKVLGVSGAGKEIFIFRSFYKFSSINFLHVLAMCNWKNHEFGHELTTVDFWIDSDEPTFKFIEKDLKLN